jgi:hypothetical protein
VPVQPAAPRVVPVPIPATPSASAKPAPPAKPKSVDDGF